MSPPSGAPPDASGPPACRPEAPAGRAPRTVLAERLGVDAADLDAWTVAVSLSLAECSFVNPGLRLHAERMAARAVLARAARLVGLLRGASHLVREEMREPHTGELELETTLDNLLAKPFPEPSDWVVQRREERRHQVVLMIDTSLSMAGEKMALAAVAAAVMALNLRPGDLSLVLFADEARLVARLYEEVPVPELVRRMLDRPCGGATNIAAALELGRTELERGRNPRRSAVLVSDGIYTAGGDPRGAASSFRALHVLLTQDPSSKGTPSGAAAGIASASAPAGGAYRRGFWVAPRRMTGPDLARAGRGQLVPVNDFAALPRRMLDLADHVLR